MSISPPSDIVLDVARAADPARFQEAAAKLSQPGSAGATAFADAARDAGLSTHMPLDARGSLLSLQNQTALTGAGSDPYKKFEGLVMQQFVEAMMPEKSETVYGKGNAGGIWKSMLAEQIGTQIAKAGGIGIAKMLNASHPAAPAAPAVDAANPAAKV
ncbi:rod-binding protein [Methylobacterium aquaticum]|uniref:rod-binding protein n=1 Tax=Methylobacterium aquaticum TaxID=270351 RepID=UPI001932AE53|nr:rod-binding protein [Methylobacterium aquaticum]QRE76683.1 flagellar biosynthesis protein FlgJ [Methylobacterium aquaticum]